MRRGGWLWVTAVALAALAGCAPAAQPAAEPAATPRPAAVAGTEPPRPAAAGGACHLLDYDVIAAHLGVRFDVAAARSSGDSHTCVLRRERERMPELVLAVTPARVDVPTFVEDFTPAGSTAVSELGKAGYLGPGLEVGWLSGDDRLLLLSLAMPDGSGPDEPGDGLLALARAIDRWRS